MLRASLVFLLTTFVHSISPGYGQQLKPAPQPNPRNIDGSAFGERIDLSSTWLFSPTDKSENASPTLDDGSWIVLTHEQILTHDFHHVGIGWYRVHVHLPPATKDVALELRGVIHGEFQAFANGVQIAGPATLRAPSGRFVYFPTNYFLSESALRDRTGDLVLAFRVGASRWHREYTGPWPSTYVFLDRPEAAPRDASYLVTHTVLPHATNGALSLLVGLVALALYLAMRSRREYLGAAVVLLVYSAFELSQVVLYTRAINLEVYQEAVSLLGAAAIVANIEFVRLVLSRQLTRLIVLTEVLAFISVFAIQVVIIATGSRYVPSLGLATLDLGPGILADILQVALLLPAFRRRNVDALVLLPLLCLSFIDDFWRLCTSILVGLARPVHLGSLPSMHLASYVFSFNSLDSFFYCTGILLFLVLRAVRIARERARVGAELESAQAMQQLLLARSSEPTPGFAVESIYLPASEVGGDFFLVSPDPHDGSITAILGDVSGKGLSAAMRVSLIFGVLRREDSREPTTILFRLNEALHSQGGVGFTTACCILLRADGAFRVANAGHISPYVDGAELGTSPGLPLGLVTGQEYEESFGQLGYGGRIVLMSDGVVEARGKTGELYGFDRLGALTLKSAKEIAATAQAFGQDDDITVLTLACMA